MQCTSSAVATTSLAAAGPRLIEEGVPAVRSSETLWASAPKGTKCAVVDHGGVHRPHDADPIPRSTARPQPPGQICARPCPLRRELHTNRRAARRAVRGGDPAVTVFGDPQRPRGSAQNRSVAARSW